MVRFSAKDVADLLHKFLYVRLTNYSYDLDALLSLHSLMFRHKQRTLIKSCHFTLVFPISSSSDRRMLLILGSQYKKFNYIT